MNFAFDEEQVSLGDTIARLLADHPALVSPDLAPADPAVWQALAELGLFMLLVPEDHGGAGLGPLDLALALEAMGGALAPAGVISTLLATDLIARHGTPVQQADLLPRIAGGELRIAIAMLESDQGYDPADVTTAVSGGTLNGAKIAVADAATADLLLVLAQGGGTPGFYLVPREAAGVTVRPHEDIDPTAGLCAVEFSGVALGDDALLSAGGAGQAVARLVDSAAAFHAALLTGIASRMLDTAIEYAKTRVQFGQAIGSFQTLKHRCADMAVALDSARSATYYAIWTVSENAPERARATSMAKAYAGDVARKICNEAIQIHGGMGFTWEIGLHRFLRRAKVIEHAFGSTAWHNERLLVESLAILAAEDAAGRAAA